MIHPGELIAVLVFICAPMAILYYFLRRWFSLKERKLELEAGKTIEKAAQYAASNAQLEARVRILEKIVTDGGIHTAAQIEALRDEPLAIAETKQ